MAFSVLSRYALAGKSVIAIGHELGISSRQCYRELERSTEAVARIVEGIVSDADTQAGEQSDPLRQHLVRLASAQPLEIELGREVADAIESVRCLADQEDVRLTFVQGATPTQIVGRRVMLRQAIVNLLSHYVHENPGQEIRVLLDRRSRQVDLQIFCPPSESLPLHATSPFAVATALLDSLGIRWTQSANESGDATFCAVFPLSEQIAVLVVDDNPDISRLYTRYLRGQPYRIHTAHTSTDAERLLDELDPAIVLLDVMMPDRDGWELLRTFRELKGDSNRRFVVCSVIDDPNLAAALGADAFLHKPVSGLALIQTLEMLRDPPSSPAGRSAASL
jgi:CheY-like chemotaxis protein